MEAIHDYPKFDESQHTYVIAMASGDGEEATPPVLEYVLNDMRCAANREDTVEEADETMESDPLWWVDSLAVYEGDEEEVATFNLKTATWE